MKCFVRNVSAAGEDLPLCVSCDGSASYAAERPESCIAVFFFSTLFVFPHQVSSLASFCLVSFGDIFRVCPAPHSSADPEECLVHKLLPHDVVVVGRREPCGRISSSREFELDCISLSSFFSGWFWVFCGSDQNWIINEDTFSSPPRIVSLVHKLRVED